MTHRLPDGDRIGWSYAQPASAAEVRKRGAMMRAWAERSASSMIQTPDAVNLMIAAMVSAREFFRKAGEHFERNLVNYYSEARRCDWFIATVSGATEPLDSSPGVSPHRSHLRFTINTDGNVRVDGDAMVTLPGGLFDEVLLLPLWQDDEQTKIIVGAIPSNAPGSSFDCAITLPEAIDCRMHCENVIVPA